MQEILQSQASTTTSPSTTPTDSTTPVDSEHGQPGPAFNVHEVVQQAEGSALKAATFYGEQFQVWASPQTAQDPEQNVSTSAELPG